MTGEEEEEEEKYKGEAQEEDENGNDDKKDAAAEEGDDEGRVGDTWTREGMERVRERAEGCADEAREGRLGGKGGKEDTAPIEKRSNAEDDEFKEKAAE